MLAHAAIFTKHYVQLVCTDSIEHLLRFVKWFHLNRAHTKALWFSEGFIMRSLAIRAHPPRFLPSGAGFAFSILVLKTLI